jgi:DNA polymerase elongation subunit (family B)
MVGVTEQGNSVMAHVYNFRPYFYAEMPPDLSMTPQDLDEMTNELNRRMEGQNVLDLEICQ